MAHYHDLAPCGYFRMQPSDRLLAVGWLEPGFDYRRGDPGEATYSALKRLFEDPLRQRRATRHRVRSAQQHPRHRLVDARPMDHLRAVWVIKTRIGSTIRQLQ